MNNIIKTEYTINTISNNNDYKIVFISDMHYGNSVNSKKLIKIVDTINNDNPDIVILGGDIVDEKTTKEELYEVFNILSTINNKYGIYYINGNHDANQYTKNKNYTKEELVGTIKNNSIKILEDDIKVINDDLVLIGRDDKSNTSRKSIFELTKDLDKNKFLISLDHSPNDYEATKACDIKLIISGHTHAGQLWPFEIFTALTNDLSYGYKKNENFNMIVSSGLSGWGFQSRTSRHSEYVLINIK
ncbi:MAG: metallophosphoesterase [Anaeroplasmataceae bacterium]